MKHVVLPALLICVLISCFLFLWQGSGWLTLPLEEEGA